MKEVKATVAEMVQGLKIRAGVATSIRARGARRLRLNALDFDLNKCFIVPAALSAMREVKKQGELHPGATLLLVGHTDTSGEAEANLDLSLARADSVAAFLKEDAEAWEARFQDAMPADRRWGVREIQMMLSVLPEVGNKYYSGPIDGKPGPGTTAAVRNLQSTAGLKVDGVVGPKTRMALIMEYFKLDGAALPAGVKVVTHGCGESFPVGLSAAALKDPALRAAEIEDGVRNEADRRVEVFFFESPLAPAPPADRKSPQAATDYPKWLEQVLETVDIG